MILRKHLFFRNFGFPPFLVPLPPTILSHLKMEIQGKRVAVVTYILKDDGGAVIQEATQENPFAFIQGMGQVLPAFDAAIEDKAAGDSYEFRINAEEGYGVYDDSRIEDLDPQIFADAPAEYIVIGATLPMEFNGHTVFGTITEIAAVPLRVEIFITTWECA